MAPPRRDVEANAPWQRLRRSLLLLLQLLLVLLLAVLAARPFLERPAGFARDLVLVIDASASMAANDVSADRLTAAKQAAIDALRDLPSDGQVSVIAASESARVVVNGLTTAAAARRDRVHRAVRHDRRSRGCPPARRGPRGTRPRCRGPRRHRCGARGGPGRPCRCAGPGHRRRARREEPGDRRPRRPDGAFGGHAVGLRERRHTDLTAATRGLELSGDGRRLEVRQISAMLDEVMNRTRRIANNLEKPSPPCLKKLLADIEAGKVDEVVVYKIDRLTRSLGRFRQPGLGLRRRNRSPSSPSRSSSCTTTSMGRLTLNVLFLPSSDGSCWRSAWRQGRRQPAQGRMDRRHCATRLRYQGQEVGHQQVRRQTVRTIFRLYLELGSFSKLVTELDRQNIVTKRRKTKVAKYQGGIPFTYGPLAYFLKLESTLGKLITAANGSRETWSNPGPPTFDASRNCSNHTP